MIDCVILWYRRMVDTFPPDYGQGSDPIYKFECRLTTIELNLRAFKSAANQGPIDLTE